MDLRQQKNQMCLQIESLQKKINQKNQEHRNGIIKEFSYDEALISLQNDIKELEVQLMLSKKDNKESKEMLQDALKKLQQSEKKR